MWGDLVVLSIYRAEWQRSVPIVDPMWAPEIGTACQCRLAMIWLSTHSYLDLHTNGR